MISNSQDQNYDTLKKEFNILSTNTNTIQNSLLSYCNYIKDLYLSPNSICNNLKKHYDSQHPLSVYSADVLVFVESGISDWEFNQVDNFKKIKDYNIKITNCISKFDTIDQLSKQLVNEQNKTDYINLKSMIFKEVKQLFDLKVTQLDIPLVNIQLSFHSLFQLLNQILSNSSPLLQHHINFKNPVLNLTPNNDFINKQQQQPSQPIVQQQRAPQRPSPPQQQQQPIAQQPIVQPVQQAKPTNQFSQFKRSAQNILKSNKVFEKMSFPAAPKLDKLVNDHELHKKLWDNKRWKLVKKYNYSVRAEYIVDLKYKKDCTIYKVLFWMSQPPELISTQHVRNSSMVLYDGNSNVELIKPEIVESDHSKIWHFCYTAPPNPYKLHYVVKEILQVDLYKVELEEVEDTNEVIEVEPITENEIEVYLRPTDKMNFNTQEFADFIVANEFYPKQFPDGTVESILCFAYRIFMWMSKNLTYKWPHSLSGKPLETFEALYGDCGCHTFFFTSIMRYSNVPTRMLFGRGAKLDLPGDGQTHVKPEIYVPDIGWFPVECTAKCGDNNYHMNCFGKDNGEFITYGMDYHASIPELSSWTPFSSFQLIGFGNLVQKGPHETEHFNHIYNVSEIKSTPITNQQTIQQPQQIRPAPITTQQPAPVSRAPPIQQSQQAPIQQQAPQKQSLGSSFSKLLNLSPQPKPSSTPSLGINFNALGLPKNPHVDKLIYDYETHKKLWNKRFKLVKTYNNSICANFQYTINYKPGAKITKSIFYISVPPQLINNQSVRYSSISAYSNDDEMNQVGTSEIIGSSHHDIYKLTWNVPLPKQTEVKRVAMKYRVDVDLYKVNLVEVVNPNEVIEVEPITENEIEVYLRPTNNMNFNTQEFELFIQSQQLYPIQFPDGSMESILCFAYRVSLFIYKNIKYQRPYAHDGKPLSTFSAGHGDCGCHSWMFASVLRFNGIPVRLLYGRGSKIGNDPQPHVKTEFYMDSIGWIPYDGAYKDGNSYHAGRFGVDGGDHVTFGLDEISDIKDLNTPDRQFCYFQNPYWFHYGQNLTVDQTSSYNVNSLN